MAELDFRGAVDEAYPSHGSGFVNMMNWLGALVSMALIAGLGWWGYQLMVRDVSGVPVVRALEGPMRVSPEDPGGQSADHQGLAVNNIAAQGQAAAPADRIVLAPRPMALADEDKPAEVLQAMSNAALAAATQSATGGQVDLNTTAEAGEPVAQDQASLIQAALLLATGQEAEPAAPAAADVTDEIAEIPSGVIPESLGGVTRSPLPAPRPATLTASLSQVLPTAAGGNVRTMDAGAIPEGTRLAQLGAFESPEIAAAEWDKLATTFDDFLSDKARVIQKAQSGGKVFYRLRAYGFDDLNDARRFCSALLAGNANCIPVVTR